MIHRRCWLGLNPTPALTLTDSCDIKLYTTSGSTPVYRVTTVLYISILYGNMIHRQLNTEKKNSSNGKCPRINYQTGIRGACWESRPTCGITTTLYSRAHLKKPVHQPEKNTQFWADWAVCSQKFIPFFATQQIRSILMQRERVCWLVVPTVVAAPSNDIIPLPAL